MWLMLQYKKSLMIKNIMIKLIENVSLPLATVLYSLVIFKHFNILLIFWYISFVQHFLALKLEPLLTLAYSWLTFSYFTNDWSHICVDVK